MALGAAAFAIFAAGWLVTASGALPEWIRNIEARTEIEAAFFRLMALPGGEVAFRRPPSETRPALGELLKKQPGNAELYSLRALEDEQQLDFTAAEGDWKSFAEKSEDKVAAQVSLADFYHRSTRSRLFPPRRAPHRMLRKSLRRLPSSAPGGRSSGFSA
jgi:hypothetical protein